MSVNIFIQISLKYKFTKLIGSVFFLLISRQLYDCRFLSLKHNGGRLCGRCEAMTQSCGYRMARRAMRLPTKPPTIIEKPAGLFDNG